jgi:hypothetical protein
LATGNNNAEAAMEWVFSHMEDPGFNDPLPPAAAAAPAAAAQQQQDPEKVGRHCSGHVLLQVTHGLTFFPLETGLHGCALVRCLRPSHLVVRY